MARQTGLLIIGGNIRTVQTADRLIDGMRPLFGFPVETLIGILCQRRPLRVSNRYDNPYWDDQISLKCLAEDEGLNTQLWFYDPDVDAEPTNSNFLTVTSSVLIYLRIHYPDEFSASLSLARQQPVTVDD